jgi:hypothetical protein
MFFHHVSLEWAFFLLDSILKSQGLCGGRAGCSLQSCISHAEPNCVNFNFCQDTAFISLFPPVGKHRNKITRTWQLMLSAFQMQMPIPPPPASGPWGSTPGPMPPVPPSMPLPMRAGSPGPGHSEPPLPPSWQPGGPGIFGSSMGPPSFMKSQHQPGLYEKGIMKSRPVKVSEVCET